MNKFPNLLKKPTHYSLAGKVPVPEPNLLGWAEWMVRSFKERMVGETFLFNKKVRVSTVFLGLDHSFFGRSKNPILFETMIFGGKQEGYQERYETWEQAEKGHKKAVQIAKGRFRRSKKH